MAMQPGFKIREIFAFIATEEDGTEGVAAKTMGGALMPMIAADTARLDSLRPHADEIAEVTGAKITLAKFSVRSDLETISE